MSGTSPGVPERDGAGDPANPERGGDVHPQASGPAGPADPAQRPESPDPARPPAQDPAATPPSPPGGLGAPPAREPARLGWWDRFTVWFGGTPPRTPRERARSRAIRRGTLLGAGMIMVGSVVTLPLLIESPGPTYNTIGEVDGQPMIVISGTETYPTDGNLDMTTVSVRGANSGGVHLGEALLSWAVPSRAVVPRESIYGPADGEEVEQRNDQLFALSQSDSIAAAMGELGIATEESVVVSVVGGGTPSDGIVEAGDVIVAVDGQEVTTPAEVGELVREHGIGETVVLDVLRAEEPDAEPQPERLEVVTAENPDPPGDDPDSAPVPYIGIVVSTQYEAPFPIDFALQNVGGPSAGMMFSLAIVDMLTEDPLAGGEHVAGTGTITPDGVVGPIGGIRQKLVGARDAGAELFLAPRDNCDEVWGNEPEGLAVVPVGTLAQARDVIQRWVDDPAATLPTCQPGIQAAGG